LSFPSVNRLIHKQNSRAIRPVYPVESIHVLPLSHSFFLFLQLHLKSGASEVEEKLSFANEHSGLCACICVWCLCMPVYVCVVLVYVCVMLVYACVCLCGACVCLCMCVWCLCMCVWCLCMPVCVCVCGACVCLCMCVWRLCMRVRACTLL